MPRKPKTRKCPECLATNPINSSFCSKCGTQISDIENFYLGHDVIIDLDFRFRPIYCNLMTPQLRAVVHELPERLQFYINSLVFWTETDIRCHRKRLLKVVDHDFLSFKEQYRGIVQTTKQGYHFVNRSLGAGIHYGVALFF